jgi:inhibitor of cysteine peptidase
MYKIGLFVLMILSFSVAKVYADELPIYTEDKPTIALSADSNQFSIQLKSNPSTGYSWFLKDYDANLIEPIKHEFLTNKDKKLIGAPGYQLWTFKVKPAAFIVPQQTRLRFVYVRPWGEDDNPTQTLFRVLTR